MTPSAMVLGTSPRFSPIRECVEKGGEALCSQRVLPPMRKPVSSRWRTFAATTCAAMCATTGACASAAFAVQAGRAEAGGGEQIGHGLADPVLGDQLLDVEIDRGRSQARTVLHARRHRVRERRLRHAAAMVAAVDRGAVFGDL